MGEARKSEDAGSALNIEALPPLSRELLETWRDEELGAWLWLKFIQTQAQDLGIPVTEITEEFCDRFVEHVQTLEVSTAKHAALEKALCLAARGDFETSGRILREYLTTGADALAWGNLGRRYVPAGIRKLEQAREFGRRGGSANQQIGKQNAAAIEKAGKELLANREKCPTVRGLSRDIARKTKIPGNTVRGHLTKAKVMEFWAEANWKKKLD